MAKRAKKSDSVVVLDTTGALHKTEYKMTEFLNALMLHKGMMYLAAEEIGLSPNTFRAWLEKYPEFKQKVDVICELVKDKIEAAILDKAINQMDNDMLKHYSNAKMRERGYGKLDTTNGTTINVAINLNPEDEDEEDDDKGEFTEFEEV